MKDEEARIEAAEKNLEVQTQEEILVKFFISIVLVGILSFLLILGVFEIAGTYFRILACATCLIVIYKFFFAAPEAYHAYLLQDGFNYKYRAKFKFGIKLPWEDVIEIINLKSMALIEIPQVFSTNDGEAKGTFSLRYKVDAGGPRDPPEDRSLNLAIFCSNEDDAVQEMVETRCLGILRSDFNSKTTDAVVQTDSEAISELLDEQLKIIERRLKVKVQEVELKDLDYTPETQKLKNAEFKGVVLSGIVAHLMDPSGGGYTNRKKAEEDAILLMPDVKLDKKQIEIVDLKEIATSVVEAIFENLKKD